MSVSCRCVISWVSNVTRCLRLKRLFKDFTKQVEASRRLISQTFWAVRKFVLMNRVWAQNWQVRQSWLQVLVAQSVLKSVDKLVASILNASSCSVTGKIQSTLFIMNWFASSKGLIMCQLSQIFKTTTVCCKSLSSTSQLLFIMQLPTSTFLWWSAIQKKPSKTISVEPTMLLGLLMKPKYLRWLWFRQIRRLIHQMLWEQPSAWLSWLSLALTNVANRPTVQFVLEMFLVAVVVWFQSLSVRLLKAGL